MKQTDNSKFDKGVTFDYLSQIKDRYVKILNEYSFNEMIPFRELIISEIFTEASSLLIAIENSSFSNLETSKRLVKKATREFFEKKNLNSVLKKYWGNNGRWGTVSISATPENISKFVSATDVTSDKVKTLIDLLIDSVNGFSPSEKHPNRKNIKPSTWLISDIVIVLIILSALFITRPKAIRASPSSGEYIYLDEFGIVHADRKCKRLNYKGMMSERIKVSDLTAEYNDFCTQCVDDEAYENLTK